ncbi:MAG TPA: hypothetical protein VFF06_35030 [Polyangia bacterium]|nr:hypothetical protein [Polyangia bacterium]
MFKAIVVLGSTLTASGSVTLVALSSLPQAACGDDQFGIIDMSVDLAPAQDIAVPRDLSGEDGGNSG